MKRLSFLIKEKVYVEIISGQKSVNEKHKNDLFRSFHHYYTYISNFIKKNSTLTKKQPTQTVDCLQGDRTFYQLYKWRPRGNSNTQSTA